jgi:hypothetical protein
MKEKGRGNLILMSSAAGRLVSLASAAYGAAEAGTLIRRHPAARIPRRYLLPEILVLRSLGGALRWSPASDSGVAIDVD